MVYSKHYYKIKYLIFHYTGMKNEKDAIKRLTDNKSKVSSHFLIGNNGKIITLVPELYIAWHAGKSSWKNKKFLNKSSIGIEISNPGHRYGYKKFNKKQIQILINLLKKLINKLSLDIQILRRKEKKIQVRNSLGKHLQEKKSLFGTK